MLLYLRWRRNTYRNLLRNNNTRTSSSSVFNAHTDRHAYTQRHRDTYTYQNLLVYEGLCDGEIDEELKKNIIPW